jgi:hypothetical protein
MPTFRPKLREKQENRTPRKPLIFKSLELEWEAAILGFNTPRRDQHFGNQ